MKHLKWALIFPLLVMMVGLIGCGPSAGVKLVKISGTATYDGKPLPTGWQVTFAPEDGSRTSFGYIEDGGKFSAVYDADHDGVAAGKVVVKVIPPRPVLEAPLENPDEAKLEKMFGFKSAGMPMEFNKNNKNVKIEFKTTE